MHVTDPIADMLTRIRNASRAKQKSVDIPASGLKQAIAQKLLETKFVKNFIVVPNQRQNVLRLFLSYTPSKKPYLTGLIRVSRPGLRVYLTKDDLSRMSQSLGIMLLSTSQGVLTDLEARQRSVGGEAICKVW